MENKYHLTFPFKGKYQFITVDANEMANSILPPTDDYSDMEESQQKKHILHEDGKQYEAIFDYFNSKVLNVYVCDDEGGMLVEGNIPWLCVKVENNGETIYDLGEYL